MPQGGSNKCPVARTVISFARAFAKYQSQYKQVGICSWYANRTAECLQSNASEAINATTIITGQQPSQRRNLYGATTTAVILVQKLALLGFQPIQDTMS